MLKKLHTFSIDHASTIDNQHYVGQFTCARITVMSRSKISIRKSQLCGGMYCVRDDNGNPTGLGIDEETEGLNYMLAVLDVALVQKPEWFKLEEISDEGLLIKVFKEVMAFDNSFRVSGGTTTQANSGSVDSSQGTGAAQHQVSNHNAPVKKMVDEQVQAALDA